MENNIHAAKAAAAAVFAGLTALWGWFGWLIVAWVVCMLIDYATGSAAALKTGKWSSRLAREGLWHKAGCIAVVAIAGVLDLVVGSILKKVLPGELPFTYTVLLCPLVVTWYILTEVGSIAENAGEMGAPIPAWMTKVIASLKGKVDQAGEKQ